MPGYKGHIGGAVAVNTVFVGALSAAPQPILDNTNYILSDTQLLTGLFVVAILFGLFPDVDTNSKGQDLFFAIALIADILLILDGRMEAAAYLGLLAMAPIVGKHRGWTHSKLAMLLVPLPIIIVPYLYNPSLWDTAILVYGAAVAGYFSHLLLDGKITRLVRIKGGR